MATAMLRRIRWKPSELVVFFDLLRAKQSPGQKVRSEMRQSERPPFSANLFDLPCKLCFPKASCPKARLKPRLESKDLPSQGLRLGPHGRVDPLDRLPLLCVQLDLPLAGRIEDVGRARVPVEFRRAGQSHPLAFLKRPNLLSAETAGNRRSGVRPRARAAGVLHLPRHAAEKNKDNQRHPTLANSLSLHGGSAPVPTFRQSMYPASIVTGECNMGTAAGQLTAAFVKSRGASGRPEAFCEEIAVSCPLHPGTIRPDYASEVQ